MTVKDIFVSQRTSRDATAELIDVKNIHYFAGCACRAAIVMHSEWGRVVIVEGAEDGRYWWSSGFAFGCPDDFALDADGLEALASLCVYGSKKRFGIIARCHSDIELIATQAGLAK